VIAMTTEQQIANHIATRGVRRCGLAERGNLRAVDMRRSIAETRAVEHDARLELARRALAVLVAVATAGREASATR